LEKSQLKAVIECLLFVSNKPLSREKIKEVLGDVDTGLIREALTELENDYNQRQSGLKLIEVAGGYQFNTRSEYAEWLKKLHKDITTFKLSQSALETLSIVAYKQPLSKAEIEEIRGVDTSGVLYNLMEKKLIKVTGRKDCLGHPLLYGTTNEFLRYFGLNNISEIPLLEEINK
jgi:segregation and condensation protein B